MAQHKTGRLLVRKVFAARRSEDKERVKGVFQEGCKRCGFLKLHEGGIGWKGRWGDEQSVMSDRGRDHGNIGCEKAC